jgi:hypothetical protein
VFGSGVVCAGDGRDVAFVKQFLIGCLIILVLLLVLVMHKVNGAEVVPVNAQKYVPLLVAEQKQRWTENPDSIALAGQVEQETCISLKSIG